MACSARRWLPAAGLALAAGLLALPAGAAASDQQLYVSPSGNDAGPGTIERPFATLHRAQRAVRERTAGMNGDIVVNLRAGTYRLDKALRLSAADSGQNGHRVVYQAYAQEHPIISGGRRITGWRRAGHGIWQARVGDRDTRQLYVDGRRARRAARVRALPGKVKMTNSGYVTDNRAPQSWRRPGDIELIYSGDFGFAEGRCGVAAISGDATSTRITMDQPCFRRARRLYRDPAEGTTLSLPAGVENSPSFLTKPGTWYLDSARHTLLYRGKDPRRAHIIAPELETLISGDNVHDLTLRGLTFSHATWLEPNKPAGFPHIYGNMYYAGGPVDPGGEVKDATIRTTPGNVAFRTGQRIVVEGNRFTQLGSLALELSGGITDSVVRGNVIDDVSGGGLWLGAMNHDAIDPRGYNRGNRVENNWVHGIGVEYRAIGIGLAQAADSIVAHNQVNDTPYSGIVALNVPHDAGTQRVQVVDNRVFDTARLLPDGGGIYANGRQGASFDTGAVIRGNVVSDVTHPGITDKRIPVPIGIYTDDFSDWISVQANVIYRSHHPTGGVMPKRIRFTGNFWDYATPGWYPTDLKPKDVAFAGNTLLRRRDPRAACGALPACAAILANAGLEPTYRRLLRNQEG